MIKTKLKIKAVPSYDIAIQQYIQKETFKGEGTKMILGVENQNNVIYRVIETFGFPDFMNVVDFITDLGLRDILAEKDSSFKGYDAIFRSVEITRNSH